MSTFKTLVEAEKAIRQEMAKNFRERLKARLTQVQGVYQALALLDAAGFEDAKPCQWYPEGKTLTVKEDDLLTIRRLLDSKELVEVTRQPSSPRQGERKTKLVNGKQQKIDYVTITLEPKEYPGLSLVYRKAIMPNDENRKCRIVTVRPKPYKTLVCES